MPHLLVPFALMPLTNILHVLMYALPPIISGWLLSVTLILPYFIIFLWEFNFLFVPLYLTSFFRYILGHKRSDLCTYVGPCLEFLMYRLNLAYLGTCSVSY
jgi:hypothetical protein